MIRGNKRAFTLIEVVITLAIALIMIGGLAAIYATSYRNLFSALHRTRIKNELSMAVKVMQRDFYESSRPMLTPANGGITLENIGAIAFIAGAVNVSPDGCAPVSPLKGKPGDADYERESPYVFIYCVNDGLLCGDRPDTILEKRPKCMFRYQGKVNTDCLGCPCQPGGRTFKDSYYPIYAQEGDWKCGEDMTYGGVKLEKRMLVNGGIQDASFASSSDSDDLEITFKTHFESKDISMVKIFRIDTENVFRINTSSDTVK